MKSIVKIFILMSAFISPINGSFAQQSASIIGRCLNRDVETSRESTPLVELLKLAGKFERENYNQRIVSDDNSVLQRIHRYVYEPADPCVYGLQIFEQKSSRRYDGKITSTEAFGNVRQWDIRKSFNENATRLVENPSGDRVDVVFKLRPMTFQYLDIAGDRYEEGEFYCTQYSITGSSDDTLRCKIASNHWDCQHHMRAYETTMTFMVEDKERVIDLLGRIFATCK